MDRQRATLKTMALAGWTATKAHNLLKEAYGDDALGKSQVFLYFKEYKEGRDSIKSQTGRHAKEMKRMPENIRAMEDQVKMDCCQTVSDIAAAIGLSISTIHLILTKDLDLIEKVTRWVPRLLSPKHKLHQMKMARNFTKLHFQQGTAFLHSTVTMDELWVGCYTPEMKRQSMQWVGKGEAAPKKTKTMKSERKLLYILFFDFKGPIYQHFVPRGQTINSDYYIEVPRTFLCHLQMKRPEKLANRWLLHQDNAQPHVSKATMKFINQKDIKLLEHTPYSPDLAPCNFFLFPKLKSNLNSQQYDTDNALI